LYIVHSGKKCQFW